MYIYIYIYIHTYIHIYSTRQHTSAHVSTRQYTSAHVSTSQHTSAYVSIRQHTSAHVSIRQHTSAHVSIRQHTAVRSLLLLSDEPLKRKRKLFHRVLRLYQGSIKALFIINVASFCDIRRTFKKGGEICHSLKRLSYTLVFSRGFPSRFLTLRRY
jgi:hypothetical protein